MTLLLSEVQVFKVYTNSYSWARSIMTMFLWLYKVTSVPFVYVCVHRSRGQILLCLCIVWFRNYMHSSIVNEVIKDVDFYRHMLDIAGCHA